MMKVTGGRKLRMGKRGKAVVVVVVVVAVVLLVVVIVVMKITRTAV